MLSYLHHNDKFVLFSREGQSDTAQSILEEIENLKELKTKLQEEEQLEPSKELMLIQQQVFFNMPLPVRDQLVSRLLDLLYRVGYKDGFDFSRHNMIARLLEEDTDFAIKIR